MMFLSAKKRKKGSLKKMRQSGVIPGVVYGPEKESFAVAVDQREFENIYEKAGESSMVELKIKDEKDPAIVLIREVALDPLEGSPLHIDFYQPRLKEQVEALVELVFEGNAPAVKELGGILVKNFSEVEVKALPMELPNRLEVDLSSLKTFDDNILIKDLKVSKGVEIMREPDEVVATVIAPREEMVEEALPEEFAPAAVEDEGAEKPSKETISKESNVKEENA